jgi:hypothetical protein
MWLSGTLSGKTLVNVNRLFVVVITTPFSLSIRVAIEEVAVRSMPSRVCPGITAAFVEMTVRARAILLRSLIGAPLSRRLPELY